MYVLVKIFGGISHIGSGTQANLQIKYAFFAYFTVSKGQQSLTGLEQASKGFETPKGLEIEKIVTIIFQIKVGGGGRFNVAKQYTGRHFGCFGIRLMIYYEDPFIQGALYNYKWGIKLA